MAFKVEVTMEESLIAEGVNKKAIVTPGSPYVWTYHARGATETDGSDEHPLATGGGRGRDPQQQPSSLRIYARSEDTDYCGLIAVQPLVCPFHDSESDVQFYSRCNLSHKSTSWLWLYKSAFLQVANYARAGDHRHQVGRQVC